MRYLLFFRQHMISQSQQAMKQDAVTWREITWAFHSSSQDLLVDLVSRQFHGRMLWEDARESGMFMWITDLTALVSDSETLALYNADKVLASAIRSHSARRIYEDGRKEPH